MSFAEERGRQPVISTGRGGAGNLINKLNSPNRGIDPQVAPGAERGRELSPHPVGELVTHSGRGGAGNIRAPSHSRTPADLKRDVQEEILQEKYIAERRGRQAEEAFSTGRGGAGNMNKSKSRSRSRSAARGAGGAVPVVAGGRRDGSQPPVLAPAVHASGRGGFGNIKEERGDSIDLEKEAANRKYEEGIAARHHADEHKHPHPVSTGRSGAGNVHVPSATDHVDMTTLTQEEREAYAKVHSHDKEHWLNTGRGGAGNMVPPSASASKDHSPAGHGHDNERGREHKGGVIGNVLRSLSRAAGREKSADRTNGQV
ncbi:hypothetical protein CI109_106113 [Kwoniella shandongensis]|uniref:Uncharacterized protein n=1 Tax=Kwoniella shandongensis TaxID=1734106 RepID=A0A5M6BQV5_9TREE|nr:uncharacterized protein CI109_006349 [Kwoniella shandongensis]KAA5525278.1 hypothetical protein CI109_006349 [Kwoniella shandongensis]